MLEDLARTLSSRAPIVRAGGVLCAPDMLDPALVGQLREEARGRLRAAREQWVPHGAQAGADLHAGARGNPGRALMSAAAGPVLDSLYARAELAGYIAAQVGREVQPTGTHASYSYYCREGHFLGLHRDIETCDVTVLICLENHVAHTASGALRVYPHAARARLDRIETGAHVGGPLGGGAPRDGADRDGADWARGRTLAMHAGMPYVLLGRIVPHEVLPLARGDMRIVAVMCFAFAAA